MRIFKKLIPLFLAIGLFGCYANGDPFWDGGGHTNDVFISHPGYYGHDGGFDHGHGGFDHGHAVGGHGPMGHGPAGHRGHSVGHASGGHHK